jgi:hypothetical protein
MKVVYYSQKTCKCSCTHRRWPSESACLPEWKCFEEFIKKAHFTHINLGSWLRFTATRLLGLRVRILSGTMMHLSCLWSVISGSGFLFTRQLKPEIKRNLIFFRNSEGFREILQRKSSAFDTNEGCRKYSRISFFLNFLSFSTSWLEICRPS